MSDVDPCPWPVGTVLKPIGLPAGITVVWVRAPDGTWRSNGLLTAETWDRLSAWITSGFVELVEKSALPDGKRLIDHQGDVWIRITSGVYYLADDGTKSPWSVAEISERYGPLAEVPR